MKLLLRYTLRFIAFLIFLVFLIIALLYVPFVQKWATNKAVEVASQKTGWRITSAPIHLGFPLEIELQDITVLPAAQNDTLFHLGHLQTDIAFWPLLKGVVKVETFSLSSFQSNMNGLIKGFDLEGYIQAFTIRGIRLQFNNHIGEVQQIGLSDADVSMRIYETVQDTLSKESKPFDWMFRIEDVRLERAKYDLDMKQTALKLACVIGTGILKKGIISIADDTYQVQKVFLDHSSYSMDLDTLPIQQSGLDVRHLNFQQIQLDVDSVYNQQQIVKAKIHSASFQERSGLTLLSLQGAYQMDSLSMHVEQLRLKTPYSQIALNGQIDMSVFDSIPHGKLECLLDASIGKKDLSFFVSPYSPNFSAHYPNQSLLFKSQIKGDMKALEIKKMEANLPDAFALKAEGYFQNLTNNKKTNAEISMDGTFQNLDFVPYLLPDKKLQQQFEIPHHITLIGSLLAHQGEYVGTLTLKDQSSELKAKGTYIPSSQRYNFDVLADNLHLERFLPASSFGVLDMEMKAYGQGFDPLSIHTSSHINATIQQFAVSKYQLQNLTLEGDWDRSIYQIALIGSDSLFNGTLSVDGKLTKKELIAQLNADLKKVDLYNLKLTSANYVVGGEVLATAQTNFKTDYYLDAQINNLALVNNGVLNKLGDIDITAKVNPDSIRMTAVNGDLSLNAEIDAGLDSLLNRVTLITDNLKNQLSHRSMDLIAIQKQLPEMIVQFNAGSQNALYGFIKSSGIRFKNMDFLLSNESEDGIRITGQTSDFRKDTLLLNNVDFSVVQRNEKIDLLASAVSKNRDTRQAFTAVVKGEIEPNQITLNLLQKNGQDKILFDVGARLNATANEMRLQIDPYQPTLLGRNWQINENNFIALTSSNHLRADFILTGEKGMKLSILTRDSLMEEGLNRLQVGLHQFDLSQFSNYLVEYPPFSGMVNGDFDVNLNKDQIDAKGRVFLDSINYNKRLLGNIVLDMNYESTPEIGHWGYASVLLEKNKIMECDLGYNPKDSASTQANMSLYDLPLKLADPFIPDAMASLQGTVSGEVHLTGQFNNPILNGRIDNKEGAVTVNYANSTYRLDSQPLLFDNSRLAFKDYKIWAYNKQPLTINGEVDFRKLDQIMTNLQLRGDNVELINVKKQKNQLVYGRLLMSLNSTVTGPVNFLKIRGNMNLLNGTNINYVMLDSPVAAQNRVSNLVTFTSFNDTIDSNFPAPVKKVTLSGIDMLLTLNINPTVQMGIDLSANGDDRVELNGGGDLAFRLNPMGETDMSGRYNLSGGFVRYNLPILPVGKTFTIQNGSYVDWSGQLMNPYINITAAEDIRTTITEEGKGSRIVNFQALILIQNRLDNLSIVFDVKAPEDASIQNQLAQMTAEERSKQAMNLIITQTYTGPGTTSKMNTNNALTAFISKEINQFAGSALKGVDVSVGIDMYDQNNSEGDSGKRTDYSFRFSKKLFNDRFRIVIGGKVSSGQEATNQQESFIEDVTLEYMLDKSGSRYIRLFHHTGYESVLEGEIVETGVGIVLQRKIRKLKQLFIFNEERRNRAIYAQPKESQNEK